METPIPWLHVDFRFRPWQDLFLSKFQPRCLANWSPTLLQSFHTKTQTPVKVKQSDIKDVISVYGWCENSLALTQLITREVDHVTFPTWTQTDCLIFKTLSCHVAYQGAVFFIAFGSGHQHSRLTVFQQIAVQELVVNCENPHVEDQDLTRSWSLTLS